MARPTSAPMICRGGPIMQRTRRPRSTRQLNKPLALAVRLSLLLVLVSPLPRGPAAQPGAENEPMMGQVPRPHAPPSETPVGRQLASTPDMLKAGAGTLTEADLPDHFAPA